MTFREGGPAEMKFDEPFDAVVGRFVLIFQDDPAAMLAKLAEHVRPGGLIVFHEIDLAGCQSFPPSRIYDSCPSLDPALITRLRPNAATIPILGQSAVAWKRGLLWRSSSPARRRRSGDDQAR